MMEGEFDGSFISRHGEKYSNWNLEQEKILRKNKSFSKNEADKFFTYYDFKEWTQ